MPAPVPMAPATSGDRPDSSELGRMGRVHLGTQFPPGSARASEFSAAAGTGDGGVRHGEEGTRRRGWSTGELAVVMRGCGCVHGDERGVEAHEFKRRPAALLRPWRCKESTGRAVGQSEDAREGERAVGDKRRLGGGPIWARPGGAVGGAHGHGSGRCQGPNGCFGACLRCSWAWSRSRERKEGAGTGQRHRACEAAHWSPRAAGARARGGSRRKREEGASTVACCGRRGTSTGARGRLEVVGGRGVNGREHADVLQSAQMAGTRGFFSRPHAPTCVWRLKEE